ncbi:DNA polymerase III subunit beta [Peptoniphilus stercorisuis]|uniref:Beta sliding clamp n=1 Tax=Peptoniphilus stercorisuis TaxID=1436965 RepID=A0ABS4KCP9_9FIRM|nr:DNA polymerase III subunit beta [Peptoniphilus stercorisuis]MBP2025553.1 DNA polymerase-3 subunit beta [Peptoniphilus stercorisuis]
MKFKVNKKAIAKHISIVQKAISNRTTLPILEGIKIVANHNIITLTATDSETAIKTSFPAIVEEEGTIVVNSRLFGDIIRKLPDDIITIEVSNYNMNILCSNSEFNIQCQNSEEFPDLPNLGDIKNLKINANDFKDAIRKTSFAVSLDETRATLTGVLMDIVDSKITFVALDGFRMALKKISIDSNINTKAIIPARNCNDLIKIIEDDVIDIDIEIGINIIKFDLGDTIFYANLLGSEFFQYEGLIKDNYKINSKVKKSDFQSSLERASLLAKEDRANLVKLSVSEDIIEIRSNSEIGSSMEIVPAETMGGELDIAFNSKYIIEGLKNLESDEITLSFTDSVNPTIIREIDDNSYIYLVLPVRLAN